MSDAATHIRSLPGLVASVVTTGLVESSFSTCFSNLRSYNDRNDLHRIEYRQQDAKLVEAGRDAVCRHALGSDYRWLLMIDADAAPFPRDAVERMLRILFVERPELDVLGAYCQLKGDPPIPTIDTGTGRWEPQPPGQGIRRVIRTGGHFLMLKTRILRAFGPPWFRTRQTLTPMRALREIDNFARMKLDGRNPLRETSAWTTLEAEAATGRREQPSDIGEDSGFCDQVMAVGGRIAVDTDLIAGHVGKQTILPEDLKEALEEDQRKRFRYVGVRGYL